jgi:hypothetical protein
VHELLSRFGIWVARSLVSDQSKKQDDLMDGFLLLALIVIYVTISYVPISQAPKNTWQIDRPEQASRSNSEVDGTRRS